MNSCYATLALGRDVNTVDHRVTGRLDKYCILLSYSICEKYTSLNRYTTQASLTTTHDPRGAGNFSASIGTCAHLTGTFCFFMFIVECAMAVLRSRTPHTVRHPVRHVRGSDTRKARGSGTPGWRRRQNEVRENDERADITKANGCRARERLHPYPSRRVGDHLVAVCFSLLYLLFFLLVVLSCFRLPL